jgi:hypothetical protein
MPANQSKLQLVKLLTIIVFPLLIVFGCKKSDLKQIASANVSYSQVLLFDACDSTVCEDCSFQEQIEDDTTEYPTVLGSTYSNPILLRT